MKKCLMQENRGKVLLDKTKNISVRQVILLYEETA